jgi:sensor histidine kinase regulating citrate/malate metabolism
LKRKTVRVTHPAPGKKGKQEVREFKTVEEAEAYIEPRAHGAVGRLARAMGKVKS